MNNYRKPDGEYTEDVLEYADAWEELAAPIEKVTGWKLGSFDPYLSFVDTSTSNWQHVQLPVAFAQALAEALKLFTESQSAP